MENSNLAIPREATILVNEIQQVPFLRKKKYNKKKKVLIFIGFLSIARHWEREI